MRHASIIQTFHHALEPCKKSLKVLFILVVLCGVQHSVHAEEFEVKAVSIPIFVQAKNKVGEARLSFLFWDVYDAQLYAPAQNFRADGEFALSLQYLMDFSGPDIAERSIDEMRGQGYRDKPQLDRWLIEMLTIFPDVKEGDTLIGVRAANGHSQFFYNGNKIGEISDPLFADAFFGIWLAPNSSEPKLRKKLLGI